MRRAMPTAVVALALAVPGWAVADSTVVSHNSMPLGVVASTSLCSAIQPGQLGNPPTVSFVTGPEGQPLGSGSVRVLATDDADQPTLSVFPDLVGEDPGAFALADLTALSVSVRPDVASAVTAYLTVETASDGVWVGTSSSAAQAAGAWSAQIDFADDTFHWIRPGQADTPVDATIPEFVTLKTAEDLSIFGVAAGNCGDEVVDAVHFDGLKIGRSGVTTTYDFEPVQATTATISATPGSVLAGKTVKVESGLTTVGGPVPVGQMELWERVFPAQDFVKVATTNTSFAGVAAVGRQPKKVARYFWKFAGNNQYGPSTSPILTVQVRTKVTIALADATLRKGQRAVLSGKTFPRKVGIQVKLWRKQGTGRALLATGKTKADGTYRFARRLNEAGRYRLFVTVAAGGGNVEGTSQLRRVRVS